MLFFPLGLSLDCWDLPAVLLPLTGTLLFMEEERKNMALYLRRKHKTYVNLSIVNVCLSAQSEGVLCDKAFPRSCNTWPLSPDRELTTD